jgi:amino acid transporter
MSSPSAASRKSEGSVTLVDRILGRRLATWEGEQEKLGPLTGVPVLGLDGLSSAAYGPEAALTILMPLGVVGLYYIGPIMIAILLLLAILYVSYRQTIAAYPNGGGSYIVAKQNLGTNVGLIAAAALLLDYVLNVAVGISAGIGALVSAMPQLQSYVLTLCLVTLGFIALVNLRGLRESGIAFGIPTFAFVASLGVVIVVGIVKSVASHGHPVAMDPLPHPAAGVATVTLWLLLRSFASGCTAMTGVEAVSNAVPAFVEPRVQNAQRTLTTIVVILGVLLAGIAYLAHAYGITAMDQAQPGYQSTLSLLVAAVFGRGFMYYVTIVSVLAVLSFSANTSFADFPRLCRLIAEDGFLPHGFANVGRRLVYSNGIIVLTLLAAALLVMFRGITDRLIPLFAVGAFAAFTLSQIGMVVHWHRTGARGHRAARAVNAIGAIATAIALGIIIVAKFQEGAWISVFLIAATSALFVGVKHHYDSVARQIDEKQPLHPATRVECPIVVIPIKGWNTLTEKALRFAMTMSDDIVAVHVSIDEESAKLVEAEWATFVGSPMRAAGLAAPRLVILSSPYRRLFKPIIEYVDELRRETDRHIAVIIPDLVEGRWWDYLMHNHRADVLRALLLLRGDQRVVTISVPWYLERARKSQ